jgi:alpha-mannosidase
MNATPTRFALLVLFLFTAGIALGRPQNDEFARAKLLKGYVRRVAGEQIDYNCFNPLAKSAILTRCTTGEMAVEWETEPIPEAASDEFAYFVWVASYSTTTSTADHHFDVFLNGIKSFTFATREKHTDTAWTVAGEGGALLGFQLVKEDAAKDANGYMYLKVPVARFGKGKPLTIKVVGQRERSKDWFMTFLYDMRDKGVEIVPVPFLRRIRGSLHQTVFVGVNYLGHDGKVWVSLDGGPKEAKGLKLGFNDFEFAVPAVNAPRTVSVSVEFEDGQVERSTCEVRPVKPRTIYLLPHSHNDIGYTAHQSDVLKKQVQNTRDALALIKKTETYPPEARFRWNLEVMWGVEAFLEQATEAERKEFFADVKNGSLELQGLYLNMLTGLMRPEEFYRLTGFARKLEKEQGVKVTSGMISDVPGMTWNMVPALAQSGIKYFSAGPNGTYKGGDRTGHTNRSWADRPFYWVSPSGGEKILYWMTGFGYGSMFAGISGANTTRLNYLRNFSAYSEWLDKIGYPYDMIQMRHTINGDNGTVDPELPDYVKGWNDEYVSPKIVIATASQLFREFEKKYGATLPSYRGDFTPYWEDGAASTAAELGLNRVAAERISQAGTLAAILDPVKYDPAKVYSAWKNVLLFDEHTWGAWNSTSEPDSPFVVRQWETKRQFALTADAASKELLADAIGGDAADGRFNAFDVVNTHSWERTDLVTIPGSRIGAAEVVMDESGSVVPQQRLSNGDLSFLAERVPGLGAKRFSVGHGTGTFASALTVDGTTITDDQLSVSVDPITGSIRRLVVRPAGIDLVSPSGTMGLNEYLYVDGFDPAKPGRVTQSTVRIKERGPLVTSLLITSSAPGCTSLEREIRVVHGQNRVDITNTIDKKRVRTGESVHLAFPFNVPAATVRADLGFGVIRPEAEQLPGGCRDYLSAQRWVDVSNQDYGVLCTVNEAPLVEVGTLHSELPQSSNLDWKTLQQSSSTIYSYVMNNYWYTNYKADQEGVSTYRYSLRPHALFNPAEAARRGMEQSQPLVLHPVVPGEPKHAPLLTLDSPNVLVSELRPAESGKGIIVRLYNAGGRPETVTVAPAGKKQSVYVSNPSEERGEKAGRLSLPPDGILTLRIE